MKKIFFVLAAVITGNRLCAQQDSSLLEEVVITASKYSTKTALSGKVVTVITREQLDQSGGKDLSQVLAEQAGFYAGGANSNPGKDKSVYLRGASPDRCLISIDGIPVYDPSGIGGNFDIRNLSVGQIERIEILKGSQSTLYGSDAIAGVINIITQKTPLKKWNGRASLSYGSNETYGAQSGLNGHAGSFDYDVSYSFRTTKGINETIDNKHTGLTDRDGLRQHSFQAGAGIRPSEKIYMRPFFRYSTNRGDIDQGAFTDERDYTWSQQSWQAGIRNELAMGNTKVFISYQYNHIDRTYTDDSTLSRNGYDIYARGRYTGSEHFADAFGVMTLSRSLKLTAGIDYRQSRSDQEFFSVGYYGPYQSRYAPDSLHRRQWGPYASLNWNGHSGFNAELGGRLVMYAANGSHFVFNANPSYLIRKKIKLFFNLSSGYRSPSLYQLYSEYGNRFLKPESALTIEGGLQYYSANDKFTGRAVGFDRRVKDGIFFFYNPVSYVSQYINQDKQNDHGMELEATYRLRKNLAFKTFFSYVTGKISTRIGNKDTTYFNLLRRPEISAGLNFSLQVTKRFFISSNLQGFGKRKDAYFDNNSFSTVYVNLEAYLLWDMHAEYVFGKNRFRFFLDLRNIGNSRYTEISGYATQGFNADGGLRFSF